MPQQAQAAYVKASSQPPRRQAAAPAAPAPVRSNHLSETDPEEDENTAAADPPFQPRRQAPAAVMGRKGPPPGRAGARPQKALGESDEVLDSDEVHSVDEDALPDEALPDSEPREDSVVHRIHARPAAGWQKLLAWTIDLSLAVGVAALYLWLGGKLLGAKPDTTGGGIDVLMFRLHAWKPLLLPGAVALFVLSFVYTALFGFKAHGRTMGRLLVGLRLVDVSGLPPTPARAIGRAFLVPLSWAIGLGGFWLALFDRRGQTLHDKLAATFVVRQAPQRNR
jgi:uncharacterized RDD family membrane protein YckC